MNKDKERDIDGVELMKKDISDTITNLVRLNYRGRVKWHGQSAKDY